MGGGCTLLPREDPGQFGDGDGDGDVLDVVWARGQRFFQPPSGDLLRPAAQLCVISPPISRLAAALKRFEGQSGGRVAEPDAKWGKVRGVLVACRPRATADLAQLITVARHKLAGPKTKKHVILHALPRKSVDKSRPLHGER